jgi:predicted phosphodiesterase
VAKKKKNEKLDVAREVLRDHPAADSRTLARLLHEKYPHHFSSIEVARSKIRYLRGAHGSRHRKVIADKTDFRKHGKPKTIHFPKGLRQVHSPMKIRQKGKFLVLSDLHIPYHCEQALESALRAGIDAGCEHLVLNGDFIDFYRLSRWDQDPRARNPEEELKVGAEVLGELNKHFGPDSVRVFKVGNHEQRYHSYLYQRAPALVGIEDFRLDRILPIKEHKWRFVHSKQEYHLGKLPMLHGHELPRGLTDPVNIGRGVYLRVAGTAMVGHWHRTSTHVETTGIDERLVPCYSLGCLCDLKPEYATINRWNHGFAIVTVGERGNYQVQNKIIHDGEVFAT